MGLWMLTEPFLNLFVNKIQVMEGRNPILLFRSQVSELVIWGIWQGSLSPRKKAKTWEAGLWQTMAVHTALPVRCMVSVARSLSLSQLCRTVIYNSAWQQSSDNLNKKNVLWIICRLWPEIRADTFRYMICFLAAVLFQSIRVTACDGKRPHHQGNESDWVTKTLPFSSPA